MPLQAPDNSGVRVGAVALSTAAAVGLAAGVALGCCALGALSALVLQRWRWSRKRCGGAGGSGFKVPAAPAPGKGADAAPSNNVSAVNAVAISANVSHSTSAASLVGSDLSQPAAAAAAARRPSLQRAAFAPAIAHGGEAQPSYTVD